MKSSYLSFLSILIVCSCSAMHVNPCNAKKICRIELMNLQSQSKTLDAISHTIDTSKQRALLLRNAQNSYEKINRKDVSLAQQCKLLIEHQRAALKSFKQ